MDGRALLRHLGARRASDVTDELSVVSFTAPVRADGLLAGMFGRIGDLVQGSGGTLFLVTRNGAAEDQLDIDQLTKRVYIGSL